MNIRKRLRASSLVSNIYYGLGIDNLPVILGTKTYDASLNQTIDKYLPNAEPELKNGIKRDIKQCYLKYKISPTEFFLFGFQNLSPEDRKTYLSDKFIYMTMGKAVGRKLHDEQLEDKYNFYQLTKAYFNRKAILVSSQKDREQFDDLALSKHDIILKPNSSACGSGISVAHIHSKEESKLVFDRIVRQGGAWIVEELIHQSSQMASWNPTCVNTIRVSSFLGDKGFHVLCPFIRTGRRGSVVDNGGQGGLYAAIDEQTGLIITNGKDELCNVYVEHPDSHIVYKGWQVPQWEDLLSLTKEIHSLFPKHKYIGWDFAHTDNGWVLIEGNWGEFIAQQSTMERGYKQEFLEYIDY